MEVTEEQRKDEISTKRYKILEISDSTDDNDGISAPSMSVGSCKRHLNYKEVRFSNPVFPA